MRFFWTLFWTFLLVQMVTYVGGSMTGAAYEFKTAAILGVAATVLIILISTVIPNKPIEENK